MVFLRDGAATVGVVKRAKVVDDWILIDNRSAELLAGEILVKLGWVKRVPHSDGWNIQKKPRASNLSRVCLWFVAARISMICLSLAQDT